MDIEVHKIMKAQDSDVPTQSPEVVTAPGMFRVRVLATAPQHAVSAFSETQIQITDGNVWSRSHIAAQNVQSAI
jgi:hypothetical protein